MNINVTVKAGSRRRGVTENADGSLTVHTNVVPEKGKANADIVDILSEHFHVPKSCVEILRGTTSRKKVIKITA